MMKKIAAAAGAGALILASAGAALASSGIYVLTGNFGQATTISGASANTGGNWQMDVAAASMRGGDAKGDDVMRTGEAVALSSADSVVNKTSVGVLDLCGCRRRRGGSPIVVGTLNMGSATTVSSANANTGRNHQSDWAALSMGGGDAKGDDSMVTGPAWGESAAGSWVNVTEVGVARGGLLIL